MLLFSNSFRHSRFLTSRNLAPSPLGIIIENRPEFRTTVTAQVKDSLYGKSLSYAPIISGKKGGRSLLDKCKKQKIVAVWRSISTESAGGLIIHSTSEVVNYKSEPEASKGNEITSVYCNTENFAENHDNTIHQAEIIRESLTVLKPNKDSKMASKAGKHSVSIQVDAALFRFIKGKWGLTQKQIEEEMGVKIIFQSTKGESSIVIEGASRGNVNKASEKITNILEECSHLKPSAIFTSSSIELAACSPALANTFPPFFYPIALVASSYSPSNCIIAARLLQSQAVKSPNVDYSHFISLPLAIHPELVEKLQSFQNSVLEEAHVKRGDMVGSSSHDSKPLEGPNTTSKLEVQNNNENVGLNMDVCGKKLFKSSTSSSSAPIMKLILLYTIGIDRSIFIKPQTFHLTVLMLKLWNKDRLATATKILKGISSKVVDALENRPVSIRLSGLACMKGSPAKAQVVYAPIEEVGGDGRLLRTCKVIIDAYVEAGLVLQNDASRPLKLHATLMNERHRKRKKSSTRNDSFDARGIFKKYGSEDWGKYVIREAHLSQRFVYDESGYYHCCASIPFPGSTHAGCICM